MIDDDYFAILKIQEDYVMKTRVVTYSCGKNTCTRTETYWEWDEVERWKSNTKTFNFLGVNHSYSAVKFDDYEYLKTITNGNTRFTFYVIPKKFKGSMYSYMNNKTISDSELFYNENIKQVMEDKEKDADSRVVFFWVFWILLTIFTNVIFVVLDNKYLNGG